jgi:hypothetical protein
MNRVAIIVLAAISAVPLAACAGNYGRPGNAYVDRLYAYEGYYDGHYGAIYDGYWGRDGGFYYRNADRERSYRRGDGAHFNRSIRPG